MKCDDSFLLVQIDLENYLLEIQFENPNRMLAFSMLLLLLLACLLTCYPLLLAGVY